MEILLPAVAIVLGGLVKGLTGFGYALISTSLLATIMPAQQAVAVMIIPLIAGNLELVLEIDIEELLNCIRNLSCYLLSLTAGVTAGMFLISFIPSRPLQMAVGAIAAVYSISRLEPVEDKFERLRKICFKSWEPVIGTSSGIIYGASNIGVPIVAYLRSQNLSHEKFTGTLAAIILLLSVYRIFLAELTGIYSGNEKILLSLILAIPAAASAKTGQILANNISTEKLEKLSLILIFVIGLKLLLPF